VKEASHLRDRYCGQCRNKLCSWALLSEDLFDKRVKTQEDRLLDNPSFAGEDHPRYFEVRAIDFPDLMREAIILEASDRKQDWEIPTIEESVSIVLGNSLGEAHRTRQVDEAVRALASARGLEPPEVPEPTEDYEEEIGKMAEPVEPEVFTVSIPSRTTENKNYTVSLDDSGNAFKCDCKAGKYDKKCSHLRDAERMVRSGMRVSVPPPAPERPSFNPPAPEFAGDVGEKRTSLFPSSYKINTQAPSQGIYIGGGQQGLPPPEEKDPWEPVKDEIVEVGSTLTIVTKK